MPATNTAATHAAIISETLDFHLATQFRLAANTVDMAVRSARETLAMIDEAFSIGVALPNDLQDRLCEAREDMWRRIDAAQRFAA